MNPQRFGSGSSDSSWTDLGRERDRPGGNPLSVLGQPRVFTGATTLKQCNDARGTSDPAAPIEWQRMEGCPPNVESDQLATFLLENMSQCRAQLYVTPEGMIVVDFRPGDVDVADLYKKTNIGELYGDIWEMPADKNDKNPTQAVETKALNKDPAPWLIRRGWNTEGEPVRTVEQDQAHYTPSAGNGTTRGLDLFEPEVVDHAMYGFIDGSGVYDRPNFGSWATQGAKARASNG